MTKTCVVVRSESIRDSAGQWGAADQDHGALEFDHDEAAAYRFLPSITGSGSSPPGVTSSRGCPAMLFLTRWFGVTLMRAARCRHFRVVLRPARVSRTTRTRDSSRATSGRASSFENKGNIFLRSARPSPASVPRQKRSHRIPDVAAGDFLTVTLVVVSHTFRGSPRGLACRPSSKSCPAACTGASVRWGGT